MSDLLAGRVAVVTGGASGNGRAICRAVARHGARAVVVADLQPDPREGGQPTHELVPAESDAAAVFVHCDVTVPADLEAAVAAADAFGGVDLMVNNAGIFRSIDFLQASEDDYTSMMDINVKGVFFGCQAAGRSMVKGARRGAIVNIGSISGLAGAASYTTYCTSKGAARLMTQAVAAALGPAGIRVNMVAPGLVDTTMTREDVALFGTEAGERISALTPLDHKGTPDDIADTVVYLASDLAQWMNGSVVVCDGGRTSTLAGGLVRPPTL